MSTTTSLPLVLTGWTQQDPLTEARAVDHALGWLGSCSPTILCVVDDTARSSAEELHAEHLGAIVAAMSTEAAIRVAHGPTVPTALTLVVEEGHDVVVVLGDGSTATTRVVERLLGECPVPVLVAPLRGNVRGENVAVAVDPTESIDLNRTLLETAATLARWRGSDLHVVHACESTGRDRTGFVETVGRASGDGLDRVIHQITSGAPAALNVVRHLVDGSASGAVDRVVALNRVGMVVTGSGGRPPIERAVPGSQSLSISGSDAHATFVVTPHSVSEMNLNL